MQQLIILYIYLEYSVSQISEVQLFLFFYSLLPTPYSLLPKIKGFCTLPV